MILFFEVSHFTVILLRRMPKAPMHVAGEWTFVLTGLSGAGAGAHHRFGSLTMLAVVPSSSQECGDPRGDKSGFLTTPEIGSSVSISPVPYRCETKALTGVTFFSLSVPVFTWPEWSLAPWPLAGGKKRNEKKAQIHNSVQEFVCEPRL